MGKNNKLINSLNEIARRNREMNVSIAAERDTVQIYAGVAIALYRLLEMQDDEKADAIKSVFVESQEIWNDCVNNGKDICQMCVDETGIDVRNEE